MKRFYWIVPALLGVAAIIAAQTAGAPQPTPAAGQSGLSPSMANGSGMQLSTGTVTEYQPGQSITVKVSKDNEVKLPLDSRVRVDGQVGVGLLAAVMWMGEGGGQRRVTSITAAPGTGDAGTANLASSYQHMSETTPGKGGTPGPSTTSGPTILTPKASTPRATRTPGPAMRTTPTPGR